MFRQAPDTLVISGGGADGIAFLGALEVLERSTCLSKLRNVVGCSVGAIMAVLLAAGMSSSQMLAWVRQGCAMGLTQLDRSGIFHIMSTLGIDDGHRIVDHIRSALRQALGAAHENPTVREFAQVTGINVTIVATNVNTALRELISVDTAPDMPILTAVRMSFAIPIIFTPVQWRDCLYVDGALIDCCPTAHIEASNDATNVIVLNINVPQAPPMPQEGGGHISLMDYGGLICRLITMRQHVVPGAVGSRPRPTILLTIDIPSKVGGLVPFNLRKMHLDITPECIDAIVAHGRQCAQQVIESAAGAPPTRPQGTTPPRRCT
jgi:predicted acylesterase/phospholipase RssA